MKLPAQLVLCVLACMLVGSFATDEVKLLAAKGVAHECPANGNEHCSAEDSWHYTTYWDFTVEVKNLAYEKAVSVWFKHPVTGNWSDFFLVWRSSGDLTHTTNTKENTDIFIGTLALNLTEATEGGQLQFVLKYTVNGITYWGRNTTNNQDFVIGGYHGVWLTPSKMALYADYKTDNATLNKYVNQWGRTIHRDQTYFTLSPITKHRNRAGKLAVLGRVHYRVQGATTWLEDVCDSYSTAPWQYGENKRSPNPSVSDDLFWYCGLTIFNIDTQRPQYVDYAFYFKYEDGEIVWDNNYTRNYRTYLTWALPA